MAANRGLRFSTAAAQLLSIVESSSRPVLEDLLWNRLSALANKKGLVASTIDAYLREGKHVSKVELDRCIQEFRKQNCYARALEIMEWMDFRNFNFELRDYGIHLNLIAKAKGIPAAEKYFSDIPPAVIGPATYGSLLNCYCAEKMSDKAETLFSKMLEEKMVSNSIPCNSLMNLYLKLQMPEKVVALSEEMKKMNVEPDTFTGNMLMRSYSILKDVEGVERALEEMEKRENGKLCNWTTYSSLAIAYLNCGNNEKAKSALKKLEEKIKRGDRVAYHFLITLYAQLSDLDNVVRVWENLKSAFTKVTNFSYIIMLQALKKVGDIKGLERCYEEWESVHSVFDVRLANTVIAAYLKHGMLQEAELVLRKALDESTGNSFTNTWNMFMTFFLENEDIERALRMMDAAAASGGDWNLKPGRLDMFLSSLNTEHDISSVKELYESMKEISSSAGAPVCGSLLRAYLSGCETREASEKGSES